MSHSCICDWLGLPDEAWPPNHYRLLGLPPGEGDAARIEQQVHDRLEVVRRYQLLHPEHATEAMNRLAQAFVCLTDPAAKQAYDLKLFQKPAAKPLEAIEETPPADTRDPLAWLYNRQSEVQDVARAVTQLDIPAIETDGPPEDAETRTLEDAPPVRRPVEPPPSANGDAAPAVPEKRDPILHAAHSSATARRGLGTKRALYHRIARTRQLLRAWHEAGQFLGHPGRRLAKPVEATDLIHGLIALRTELQSFPPLLGQAGQPGYLVIALARQQVIVPTFQTLLPSQREALARDWRAGLKLLDAHLRFLREELRALRHRGLLGRMARGINALLHNHLGLVLLLVMVLAIVIALCRSVGTEWVGSLLESVEDGSPHASVGSVPKDEGVAKHPRPIGSPRHGTESVKKDDPRSTGEEKPKVGSPLPADPPSEVEAPVPPAKKDEPEKPRRFQAEDIHCINCVAFLHDQRLVFCNGKGNLSFWDAASDSPRVVEMSGSLICLAYSPNTGKVASGDEKGGIYLFDENAYGKDIRESKLPEAPGKAVSALAFSADGKWLSSGDADGNVVLWDASSRKLNRTIADQGKPVRAVALSTKGEKVFWGGVDGKVRTWDAMRAREMDLPKGPTETITSLVLSPDDRFLFCACKDWSIWRWDLTHENEAPRQEKPEAEARCLAVSPDGRYLLAGHDKKIKVWDAQTGKHLHNLDGKYDLVCSLAFSPDGKYLVSGHADGVLILWPMALIEKPPEPNGK
jgi:hypothetical protein